jgi:hypothetical protein
VYPEIMSTMTINSIVATKISPAVIVGTIAISVVVAIVELDSLQDVDANAKKPLLIDVVEASSTIGLVLSQLSIS